MISDSVGGGVAETQGGSSAGAQAASATSTIAGETGNRGMS
jgi:hypothetical protein